MMSCTKRHMAVGLLVAVGGFLHGTATHAAPLTLAGDQVDFVYDDMLSGLLGTPTVSGNTLFFSPAGFTATSLNGNGYNFMSATLSIDVIAHGGYDFADLSLDELGEYQLHGPHSNIMVDSGLTVIAPGNPQLSGSYATSFLASTGGLRRSNSALHAWSAGTQVDLDGNAWGMTETLRISLGTMLEAYTAPMSCSSAPQSARPNRAPDKEKHDVAGNCAPQLAFIKKKYVGLNVDMITAQTAVVPLPAGLTLFLTGLLSIIGTGAHRAANS